MAKTSVINIRTDAETKKSIEKLYAAFGITISDAVNIFFKKSLMQNGLPFEMQLPRYNAETIAAMEEADTISQDPNVKSYASFSELLEEVTEEMKNDV